MKKQSVNVGKNKEKNTEKRNIRRIYGIGLAVLLTIGILVPLVFTAVQMGVFAGEPQAEYVSTVTDPDAPLLTVASDYDFCPNSYYNEEGELSGLYIEIVTEAANRMGMRIEFTTGAWLDCRQMLTDGDVDVLLGLEIFSNMEGTLRTIPICSDDLRVYGKEAVESAASLAGKKVALMARSVIETTYDLQCEYVEYYTNTEILQAVENGDVDYAICHSAVSSKIIEKNGFDLQPGVTISKSYPALAVSDSRPDLKEKLNKVLQSMSDDGTIGKLQKKWITEFTRNKSLQYVLKSNGMFYITFLFAILVVLGVCIVFHLMEKKQAEYIKSLLDYQYRLKLSNDEAVRANRSKSVFLSHMSHDIRTPMNGIMGMVDRIRRNESNPKIVEDSLTKIDAASGHLLSLLNDILDMSALEQGKVKLESKPFDLTAELHDIELMIGEQQNEKNVTFEMHLDDLPHTRLIGSPLHLKRILLNLISNGIKYNKPNGRVNLTVHELRSTATTATFRFIVQDTGIGMSPEFLKDHLYKPFTQENDNVRTVYQGTGLGMSIVDQLVKGMGGTISAESEVNVGTAFILELPFAINTMPEGEKVKAKQRADISGMHILLVEDNALNAEIAQSLLEDAGAKITLAENGKIAVEKFEAAPPYAFDAILMDVMMPVMDGIHATQAIRALSRGDAYTVPIIAMTANAFDEDRKKVLDAGMDDYLTKPIDPKAVCATLAKYRNNGEIR